MVRHRHPKTTVALALQGGGSHAAFAAGVMQRFFEDPAFDERYQLVALSGTSGGAITAAAAWSALVRSDGDRREGRDAVVGLWDRIQVNWLRPMEYLANEWGRWLAGMNLELSPYWTPPVAEMMLRQWIGRFVRFDELAKVNLHQAWPRLYVGLTDVLLGEGKIVPGWELDEDHLVASAAVPPLFRAVEAGGRMYWDGLFTHNPPVRQFTDLAPPPEELWVVRVNPSSSPRVPESINQSMDRRNELAGNVALDQELYFIHRVNRWLAEGRLKAETPGGKTYLPIRIKVLPLSNREGPSWPADGLEDDDLDYASKLDRRPKLVETLRERGRAKAELLLGDALVESTAHDLEDERSRLGNGQARPRQR